MSVHGLQSAFCGPRPHTFQLPLSHPAGGANRTFRVRCPRTPWDFVSLRRHQPQKPGPLGFTTPNTFPSRCFSHPQGFASPATLQPCFMLLPSMGFSPSERSPLQWPATVSGPTPHMALHDLAVTRSELGEPSLVRTPCRGLTHSVDDSTIRRASLATVRAASWVYHWRVRF